MHWDSSTFCSCDPHCKGRRGSAVVLLERELKGHTELSDLKNRFKSHLAQKPMQKARNSPISDLDVGLVKFLQGYKLADIEIPQPRMPLTSLGGLRKTGKCQNN